MLAKKRWQDDYDDPRDRWKKRKKRPTKKRRPSRKKEKVALKKEPPLTEKKPAKETRKPLRSRKTKKGKLVVTKDGKVYYGYYKKKIGRPKKPGPKKKPKPRSCKNLVKGYPFKFWIMMYRNGKRMYDYGRFTDYDRASSKMKDILRFEKETILFPKETVYNGRRGTKGRYDSEYVMFEYVLPDMREERSPSYIENEYGKAVRHETDSDKWRVYEKHPHLVEDTMWVYGYDNQRDRKDIHWVMTNLIDDYMQTSDFIRIYIYKNKLIFRYDNGFEFTIMKSVGEAIRLYNTLLKVYKKHRKSKNVFFLGITEPRDDRALDTIDMIQRKTGWKRDKITRCASGRV